MRAVAALVVALMVAGPASSSVSVRRFVDGDGEVVARIKWQEESVDWREYHPKVELWNWKRASEVPGERGEPFIGLWASRPGRVDVPCSVVPECVWINVVLVERATGVNVKLERAESERICWESVTLTSKSMHEEPSTCNDDVDGIDDELRHRQRYMSERIQTLGRAEEPIRISLGAGPTDIVGWMHSDQDSLDIRKERDFLKLFGVQKASAFLAEHVWEHLDAVEALRAAKNCLAFMRPNGSYLRVAVPKGFGDDKDLADGHKVQYSVASLRQLFRAAGFDRIQLRESPQFFTSPWPAFEHEATPTDARWGYIKRSARFDERGPVSIIIDALRARPVSEPATLVHHAIRVLQIAPGNADALAVLALHQDFSIQRIIKALSSLAVEDRVYLIRVANKVQPGCCVGLFREAVKELSVAERHRLARSISQELARQAANVQDPFAQSLAGLLATVSKISPHRSDGVWAGKPAPSLLEIEIVGLHKVSSYCVLSQCFDAMSQRRVRLRVRENLCALQVRLFRTLPDLSAALFARVPISNLCESTEIRRFSPTRLCAFTLVLNGMPFIRHHIDVLRQLEWSFSVSWEWHVVEGPAHGRAHRNRPYALGKLSQAYFNDNGTSVDGTSEYLDTLANAFPGQVFLHRPPRDRGFWLDKLEMTNVALDGIQPQSCTLLQLDADELWSAQALAKAARLFDDREQECALVDCHFFIAPDLVTTSRGAGIYSHDDRSEWLRLWKLREAEEYLWAAHAPPLLLRLAAGGRWHPLAGDCIAHSITTGQLGIAFTHYAYYFRHQVEFKEHFYGYDGAVHAWQSLRDEWLTNLTAGTASGPVDVAKRLSWIYKEKNNGAPVWADDPRKSPIAANVLIVPIPGNAFGRARAKHIVVDTVVFQMHQGSAGGIARVWSSVLPLLAEKLECQQHRMTVLVRQDWPPTSSDLMEASLQQLANHPCVVLKAIEPYNDQKEAMAENDRVLAKYCHQLQPDVFLSTYYTHCTSAPKESAAAKHIVLLHDMIPEELRWDLNLPEWQAKQNAIRYADAFVSISQTTRDSFRIFYPEKSSARHMVAPLAVDTSIFAPLRSGKAYSFVFVGPRRGYKGGDAFFQSIDLVCSKRAVRIAMVGGGAPTQREKNALEACVYPSTIEYFGDFVPDWRLATIFSSASALVYLSVREGFGLPVVEAMACGCPVILMSSNKASVEIAGGPDSLAAYIIETQGLLAQTIASTALQALEDVDDLETRAKISRAAIARAHLFKSWQPLAEAFLTLAI